MTQLEIKGLIYAFLRQKDTLVLPDDFNSLVNLKELKILEYPEMVVEQVKLALQPFVDNNIIKQVSFLDGKKNKTAYVLEKPLHTFSQTIELNGDLCYNICSTLNSIRSDDDKAVSDSLAISPMDIEELLIVAAGLIKKYQDERDSKAEQE